jgi:F0F1-type ATP synthase membrane subunit c/vacuolar-type H+-ATPase subunit K
MFNPVRYPLFVSVVSTALFWVGARIGSISHARQRKPDESMLDDFKLILGATLTLLGLIIGFSFSMAVSRYDQRKNLEEQEANAIGTEYVRADLLPATDRARVQTLLKSYLEQRILFYTTSDVQLLEHIDIRTAQLQTEMWSSVSGPASQRPTILSALVIAGMNDVLNAQGYTQAAWWNRIPVAAWCLLIAIGIFCNVLVGYVARDRSAFLFWILPIVLAISVFLIADIDSPRHGVIRVHPQNLQNLASSLRTH